MLACAVVPPRVLTATLSYEAYQNPHNNDVDATSVFISPNDNIDSTTTGAFAQVMKPVPVTSNIVHAVYAVSIFGSTTMAGTVIFNTVINNVVVPELTQTVNVPASPAVNAIYTAFAAARLPVYAGAGVAVSVAGTLVINLPEGAEELIHTTATLSFYKE
jgi:hypothetical protein